jgi:hypothetical protein
MKLGKSLGSTEERQRVRVRGMGAATPKGAARPRSYAFPDDLWTSPDHDLICVAR